MSTLEKMTAEQFSKRLANLCLRSGLAGMPKDEMDQHVLLKSVVLMVPAAGALSEMEINEKLQAWLSQVCVIKNFDRVTLRRWLVDTGYLTRSSNGAAYQVARPAPRADLFEDSVDQIDVLGAIQAEREEMERRRQAYLAKSRGA